jgi:DNA polymerase III delta subunit
VKFKELKAHLRSSLLPVYVFAGDDPYLIKKAEDMFSALIPLPEINISRLADTADENEFFIVMNTPPIGSEKRLVFASEKNLPMLKKAGIKDFLPTVLIVSSSQLSPKDTSFFSHELVDCNRLDTATLTLSISHECSKNNCNISDETATLLIDYCGRKMGRIRSELDKLLSYVSGQEIVAADIRAMVRPEKEARAFLLCDAIANRDTAKALDVYAEMEDGVGANVKILGLLYSGFRRMLFASLCKGDERLSTYMGVKPYAITAAQKSSKHFSKIYLKNMLSELAQIDEAIKSGEMTDKDILLSFIIKTCFRP